MGVTQILRRLEWDKNPKQRRINGQQVRVWQPINQLQPPTEVVTSNNPYTASSTAISTSVTTPKMEITEVVTPSNPCNTKGVDTLTNATVSKVVTEVVTPSKLDTSGDSEQVSPPFIKIDQNFSEETKQQNISSHLQPEESLHKLVVTVVTEAETTALSTFNAVTTPCHNPVSPPKAEFDAAAHAQTMLELLQEENAGEWIDELMKDWSNRQKILVRSQLTPQQYQVVKAALHQFNSDKYS